jgi:hypothetical protein
MKKELFIYSVVFLLLAISWHFDQWLSHPMDHIANLPNGGAFGVPGLAHPFVFTFIVYLFVSIPRWLFGKKKDTVQEL